MVKEETYCFCGSNDGSIFMIQCDGCQIWFHGQCVNITKKQAKKIDQWFCDRCKGVKQCKQPDCTKEARMDSEYCSEECGYKLAKLRYDKFFKPRWENLERNHSVARLEKMKELHRLEAEKEDVIQSIGRLKTEKEELEDNIRQIKDDAKRLRTENEASKDGKKDESENDTDDVCDVVPTDQSKVFCIICGITVPADNTFKHWTACHKKQESNYNYSSDAPYRYSCATDENPKLYCQRQDKKTKRYCMHIESACPQHSNWHFDKDEVCGCPLNIMQKIVPDNNYCLELKRDCTLHYHWDRFRLASKNMERIQAFTRLDALTDHINKVQSSLNDTYGGIVGVMTHRTIDHADNQRNYPSSAFDNNLDIDVMDE